MPAPRSPEGAPAEAETADLVLCLLLQTVRVRHPPVPELAPGALDAVLAQLARPAADGTRPPWPPPRLPLTV